MLPKAAGTDGFISSATAVCWVTYRSADASPITVFANGDETHSYRFLLLALFISFSFWSFFPDGKQRNQEVGRAKDLSAPLYSLRYRIFCSETYPIPAGDKASDA
jgi:hypothetical protein